LRADPYLWNLAADIVVNGIIKETQGLVLPKSALIDDELAPYTVEEVYHVLLKRLGLPEKIVFIGERPVGARGGDGTASGLGEHWNSAFAQAAVVARMGTEFGKLPAGIERAMAAVLDPPLDWRTLLWRHLIRTPVDFTAYDRRFIGEELYLDALDGESVRVAVCVDTSGSIGEEGVGKVPQRNPCDPFRVSLDRGGPVLLRHKACGPLEAGFTGLPRSKNAGRRRHGVRAVFRGIGKISS
jgi:predicted metal-dependent peptidase